MNEYDCYVENYLLRFLRTPLADYAPINYDLEYLISLAGQIEYFLGKTKEATCHVFNGLSFSLNGKLVEIKFQDNCFDKIVTESRYYRIPTLFEQLGINNSLMPKVEVPLINLFHQITRNMNFTDTICQIADLL
ncbi:MAG: hypothetical protein WC082_07285, partial [Victivallales bacterium]